MNSVRATSATHVRYERIRTVGKGAFGSAVLYRRREDSSLVIIKEINMYELDSSQRRLALNEVSLLSRIEHPNIIGYYDSFEEDGVLMIEMEYADGGTLAQLLAKTQIPLEEQQIIDMMCQMLSAVAYLHKNSVLHRDLKTANVFLTKDSFVKIGDFGISKIMGTETLAQGAKTVVGTPYYISPEMCSGMAYNEKSDMWALGCILYEMCCLKKAFEGDNLPALVNNIMTCTYAPVKASYSSEIKMVIRELLQLDPEKRLSASNALKMIRPSEVRHRHTSGVIRSSVSYSTLYELHTSTILLSLVSRLPARISIKQISVSESHTLILTNDNEVFGWGDNSNGQLGIEKIGNIQNPKMIESLRGRNIQSIGTGNQFSVICCDRGALLTIGNAKYLGQGNGKDVVDSSKPVLVEQLLRENIKEILCGHEHAIAILENGECYGWGNNQYGQLGLVKTEHFYNPTKILIPSNKKIIYGKAGKDATLLMAEDGSIMAMGSNMFNKLNLTPHFGFFAKEKKESSDFVMKPTVLQGFPERVVDFSVGPFHTGVVLESGQIILFGRNENGELGHGHCQKIPVRCIKLVKSLLHHPCTQVICGDGFTLASTINQELYFWGRKVSGDAAIFFEDLEETMTTTIHSASAKRSEPFDANIVMTPSLILRLLSDRDDKTIRLSGIAASGKRVFVAVDSLEGRRLPTALLSTSDHQRGRSGSEPLISDKTRTWLREEFEKAEVIPIETAMTKRRVRFNSSSDKLITEAPINESALLIEIDELKRKIKEQDTTFEGHRIQMSDLEQKLQELQTKQSFIRKSEPPPAYDKPNVSYNTLFAEKTTSTTCIIL